GELSRQPRRDALAAQHFIECSYSCDTEDGFPDLPIPAQQNSTRCASHHLSSIQSTKDSSRRFPRGSHKHLKRHESSLQRVATTVTYSSKISQLVNSGVVQCRARVGAVFCAFPWCL